MANWYAVDTPVETSIWRTVAGVSGSPTVPTVNSLVYYFPDGHLDHAIAKFSGESPCLCRVLSVHHLCDAFSDDIFVEILLQPIESEEEEQLNLNREERNDIVSEEEQLNLNREERNDIVSFSKPLTLSDANNGGGFSMPKLCADMIFPALDHSVEIPSQILRIRDLHGKPWELRHVYRGGPVRNLLTAGWSTLVKQKNLMAGDSVVFVRRKSTKELFLGIRRKIEHSRRYLHSSIVAAAVRQAKKRMPFSVVYYPKLGLPGFVMGSEIVKSAVEKSWVKGLRVKMSIESYGYPRTTWFHGTVVNSPIPARRITANLWTHSPWRILEVKWDAPCPGIFEHLKRVSPWQVEVSDLIELPPQMPPANYRDHGNRAVEMSVALLHTLESSNLSKKNEIELQSGGRGRDRKYLRLFGKKIEVQEDKTQDD